MLARFDRFYTLSFGKRPAEELYALPADAANLTNLADDPDHRVGESAAPRDRMFELLKAEGDPRALGNAAVFDRYRYTGPKPHGWDAFEAATRGDR